VRLRRFTPEGIEAFRAILRASRETPTEEFPLELLEHPTLTELVEPAVSVGEVQFETKGDAARYLSTILAPIPDDDVRLDAGMWTWLSLVYLDSVCQHTEHGRDVKNDYYYVFEPLNPRHFYRHLLFVSWRVIRLSPVHNRVFLRSPSNQLDKITEEVMKRLFLTRIPSAFELIDRLYWDEKRSRPRVGITRSVVRAGDLSHRLPLRIRQLEKTYDLMSLTADQLIELLGEEFEFARPASKRLFAVE
jgi:hypothetical protein